MLSVEWCSTAAVAHLRKPSYPSELPYKVPSPYSTKLRVYFVYVLSHNGRIYTCEIRYRWSLMWLMPYPKYTRNRCMQQPLAYISKHCFNRKYYTITLWFPCLDGLIQTRGNVARVEKNARNTSRRRVILRAFLNSSNIPKCLDQAIQTWKP
jgi:hypothetical protein